MAQGSIVKHISKIALTGLIATLGAMTLKPQATLAAEQISFTLPIFGEFDLSVDSLETFAKEGKITKEFNFYAKRFDKETLAIFRQILQREFELEPTAIYNQTN